MFQSRDNPDDPGEWPLLLTATARPEWLADETSYQQIEIKRSRETVWQ